jgi:CheY-like chemotaxis protein
MKTVLLIEDNLEIRENTTELLELEGFVVLAADSGGAGISLARSARPDLILCDIMMPGLNGYDVIRELKQDHVTSLIPFIYVTASGERDEIGLAMDLGANGFLRKPFEAKDLLQIVTRHLA